MTRLSLTRDSDSLTGVVKLTMMVFAAVVQFTPGSIDRSKPVELALRNALHSTKGVTFSYNEHTLVVKFRTHNVKIPRPTKTHRLRLEELVPVEQPTLTGFRLEVYESSYLGGEPALPMQTARMNPNWLRDYGSYKMDAGYRQVEHSDTARYYRLEWGNKLDPTLLSKIREAVVQGTKLIGR